MAAFALKILEEHFLVDFEAARQRLAKDFGEPCRVTKKVEAWDVNGVGVVLQIDQPNREAACYIWVPYPPDGALVPEIALEYPENAGRHHHAYPSHGLEKGKPALKLVIRTEREFDDVISYIQAMAGKKELPAIKTDHFEASKPIPVEAISVQGTSSSGRTRREAIPRAIQREIWRRDEGRCIECSSKERLCFDHIIPFSRGGSNTGRNLQLLCERCNLSKGNRI